MYRTSADTVNVLILQLLKTTLWLLNGYLKATTITTIIIIRY